MCVPLHSLSPSTSKSDATAIEVTNEVIIEVGLVCVSNLHLNYLARANFRINITKVLAHKNVWVLASIFGWDQISRSRNDKLLMCSARAT